MTPALAIAPLDAAGSGDLANPTRSPAVRPGAITLARHGEPALSRRVRLNAEEYDAWWARYEVGGLKPGQTPPAGLLATARDAEVIVSSTLPRSVETAQAVAGARPITSDAVLVEAPLPPPRWPAFLKLKPRTWGVIARTAWWFFNLHRGRETRAEAKRRAAAAADRLEGLAEGGDVLVLAHGFFNAMIGVELRRRGWRRVSSQGYRYWCAQRFERG